MVRPLDRATFVVARDESYDNGGFLTMNIDLRQAIVQRVQGKSTEELTDVIEGSIDSTDQALPGLGVLFEIIWKNTDEPTHSTLVQALKDHLPQ